MTAMSHDEIVVAVVKACNGSSNYANSNLQRERIDVLRYYRGELPRHTEGRSRYVSRDVYDGVDSMRSQLLEAFSGNNRLIRFAPLGPEDVEPSREATEYCSHVFFQQNPGLQTQYNAITDGLTSRFGVVKVLFEETPGEEKEYDGLTDDELDAALEQHKGAGIVKDDVDDETGQLHSGSFRARPEKRIAVCNIPPEEILMSPDTQDIQTCYAFVHRHDKTKSQLIRMGYPKDVVDGLPTGTGNMSNDMERQERFKEVGGYIKGGDFAEENRTVMIDEAYLFLDIDGNGVADLWKIVIAAETTMLGEPEKLRKRPFEAFVAIPTPYTIWGENFAQSLIPIQNARTTLIRGVLDHTVITNNPRLLVANGALQNPQELMDNRLGGLVNVRNIQGVSPLPQSPLNPYVFQVIGMLDSDKEEVTGISKLSQGLNKDAISKQNSQAMVQDMITVSQQRSKIMARQFGEFMKRIFLLIYDTALAYMDGEEVVEIAGSFTKVDPSAWQQRKVATLELALGYNERQKEAQKWMAIDQYLKSDPTVGTAYGPQQRYEVRKRALAAMGVADVEQICLPPGKAPPPPPPSPTEQLQMAMISAQVELLKAQAAFQTAKAQDTPAQSQTDIQTETGKLALAQQEFVHKVAMDLFEQQQIKDTPAAARKTNVGINST